MRIKSLWDKFILENPPQSLGKGEYHLHRIEELKNISAFIGVDSFENYIFALNVKIRPPAIALKSQAINYLSTERADKSWFMTLRLVDPKLVVVFQKLCEDLIESSVSCNSEVALIALVERRLKAWEKLFQSSENGLLQEFRIRGLLGELIFLHQAISQEADRIDEVLNAWLGPLGADQDFIFGDIAYEIKTIQVNIDKVSISSLEQLDSKKTLVLVIFELLKVGKYEESAHTLNALVNSIENILSSKSELLMIFREILLEFGYVNHEHYDNYSYLIQSQEKYNVVEGFPKITKSDVPNAISSCQYKINLSEIAPFKL